MRILYCLEFWAKIFLAHSGKIGTVEYYEKLSFQNRLNVFTVLATTGAAERRS